MVQLRTAALLSSLEAGMRERLERLPTQLNEYGYDSFGLKPESVQHFALLGSLLYRYYHRVEAHGIERVPAGRVVIAANHAGNTLPMDGAMLAMALLLEAEPPRLVRGMAEYYLPRLPWWSTLLQRTGAIVGTPENCTQLLERDEAVLVFPEGSRGFVKPWSLRYQLQRFGHGFARLAIRAGAPVLPVGIVGSEEQNPGLANALPLARLIGASAFPITWMFPALGPLGFLPLPVKLRLHFGEPLQLVGDPDGDPVELAEQVGRVRDHIAVQIEEGLSERRGWFR